MSTEKSIAIRGFSGLSDCRFATGQLKAAENIRLLPSGAVRSLLAERELDLLGDYAPLEPGVYSGFFITDPNYETPIDADWIYTHIAPSSVRAYTSAEVQAMRFLVGEAVLAGKTEDGYRNILGAFADGENMYVLYDAVYPMIEQQRDGEQSASGTGIVVQFSAANSSSDGTYTRYCTLQQLWMDTIDAAGQVHSHLLDARYSNLKNITSNNSATMISTDKKVYHYFSAEYAPNIGGSYTGRQDLVYVQRYLSLSSGYTARYEKYASPMRIVRYRNTQNAEEDYKSAGEKLLLLPDRLLLSRAEDVYTVQARGGNSIPAFTDAVQHFGRLFGVVGDRIYASADGDCTNFMLPAAGNTDVTCAWTATAAGAGGGFTAIRSFGGKIVAFTAESMMTVRGNELPFTLGYVGAYGCLSSGAVVTVEDALYFVSAQGVMRYNGTSVTPIGTELPIRDYQNARLAVANGLLLLSTPERLYFYDPRAGAWTARSGDFQNRALIGGDLYEITSQNGTRLGKLFAEPGEFAFSVALAFAGRRKLRSVALTASGEAGSMLRLENAQGEALLSVSPTPSPRTYNVLLRNLYMDSGLLRFSGSGNVTVYALDIGYTSLSDRTVQLKEETV